MLAQLLQVTAINTFMKFGQLARRHAGPVSAQDLHHIAQGIADAMHRFKKYQCFGARADFLQTAHTFAAAGGQKAHKQNRISRQTGNGNRCRHGAAARYRADLNSFARGSCNQPVTGVTQQRGASVAHQSHIFSGFQQRKNFRNSFALIVFMTGSQAVTDSKQLKQLARAARILGSYQCNGVQHSARPNTDIIQIADRRGDDEQCSAAGIHN